MVLFWVVWGGLFGFGEGRVNWFVLGFFFFLQKAHVFNFVLGLQQVINVHLTGAALVKIDAHFVWLKLSCLLHCLYVIYISVRHCTVC